MSNRLQGKRCLIVGGTSGIGLAAARRFLQEGARVVISGLNDAYGAASIQVLQGCGEVCFFPSEASSEYEAESLTWKTCASLGGLDVLYHVFGISGRKHGDAALHECSLAGWNITLDANLKSVFLSNRGAVRQFLKQGTGGTILNMSSVLALAPSPLYFDTVAYAASKGGIIAMSRQAAARYAADKIRINVLAPGLIDTPMAARAVNDPAIRAFLETKQPLGPGPGTTDDCADAAVFLCSDEARFITGTVLPIDGGWQLSDGQFAEAD